MGCDLKFNALRRNSRYVFSCIGATRDIDAVFHEYLPDGTLLVVGDFIGNNWKNTPKEFRINSDAIAFVYPKSRGG